QRMVRARSASRADPSTRRISDAGGTGQRRWPGASLGLPSEPAPRSIAVSATTQSPVDAADASVERRARWQGRAADEWRRVEPLVYALLCMGCTLYAAAAFYGYMLVQTGGHWSAPLDDVFIHFDYARSFARGYPFAWSEGNGYSSGNTSLTYPIALALGYWLGFRQLNLMVWAACVACLGIFAFLLAAGKLALWAPAGSLGPERRWMRFAIPPAVLSMGALDW